MFLRQMMVAAAMAVSAVASAAPVTQLGFALDGSGSVAGSDYNLLRTGLNAALAGLPVNGTVEITVVAYGSGVNTVVAPTVLTSASLLAIQTAITTHAKYGGGTASDAAIRQLTADMTGSANFSDPGTKSIINLATDGQPNSQSATEAAAIAAADAGIDALSIEAIGSGVSSNSALNNMASIAFPGPATILAVNSTNIPNPIGGSWVVPVSDFSALAPVLAAKVQAAITPEEPNDVPEPGMLALMGLGIVGLLATRRRVHSTTSERLAFA